MKKERILICDCHSFEHQAIFWQEPEYGNNLHIYIHLITYRNFFRRLWFGLKYAFGYKSRFSAWDQFIFNDENEKILRDYLNNKDQISKI